MVAEEERENKAGPLLFSRFLSVVKTDSTLTNLSKHDYNLLRSNRLHRVYTHKLRNGEILVPFNNEQN
jgi:hypothetical protein